MWEGEIAANIQAEHLYRQLEVQDNSLANFTKLLM